MTGPYRGSEPPSLEMSEILTNTPGPPYMGITQSNLCNSAFAISCPRCDLCGASGDTSIDVPTCAPDPSPPGFPITFVHCVVQSTQNYDIFLTMPHGCKIGLIGMYWKRKYRYGNGAKCNGHTRLSVGNPNNKTDPINWSLNLTKCGIRLFPLSNDESCTRYSPDSCSSCFKDTCKLAQNYLFPVFNDNVGSRCYIDSHLEMLSFFGILVCAVTLKQITSSVMFFALEPLTMFNLIPIASDNILILVYLVWRITCHKPPGYRDKILFADDQLQALSSRFPTSMIIWRVLELTQCGVNSRCCC